MTKFTKTTPDSLRLISGAQNMFGEGPEVGFSFNEYIPIIGGARTELVAESARAFGGGRASVEEDKISWDDQGEFDGLANGETREVAVTWNVFEADGTPVQVGLDAAGMLIEVTGTENGPVFTNKTTGEVSTDGMTVVAFSAKDMLQEVHDFDPVTLIDIDLDIDELLDVDLGEAFDDVADIGELAFLAGKIGFLESASVAAGETVDLARKAFRKIDDLEAEKKLAEIAKDGAEELIDTAEDAIDLAEDLVNGAKDLVADAARAVDDAVDALGSFFSDAAFELRVNALKAEKVASENAGIFDFFLRDPSTIQRDINELNADKRALDRAERDKRDADSDLDRFANDLENAEFDLSEAKKALKKAEADINEAVDNLAEEVEKFRKDFQADSIEQLENLRDAANSELNETNFEIIKKLEALQERGILTDLEIQETKLPIFTQGGGFGGFQTLKSVGSDVIDALVNLAIGGVKAVDDATFGVTEQIDASAGIQVDVDAFAQAGLVVDFEVSGGSVKSDLQYDLTSIATLDTDADTFTINAQATSATTGEAVAFNTVSPNLSFFAGIAYNAGATFEVLLDLFADVAGIELFNLGPITETIDVAFDGVLTLMDFDSTEFEGLEIPFPGLLEDIVEAEVNFPTVVTEGKAADFSADPYTDPTSLVDLDKIADLIVNLTDLRLDFSEEFKALQAKRGAETELTDEDFGTAVKEALAVILDSLGEEGDTNGDGFVPILQVKTGEKGADALIHLDTIQPDLSDLDLENGGEFGFFVSQGASNNLLEMRLDVDQLIATAVNVALGNSSGSTINPLDLSIGIGEVLDLAKVPEDIQEVVDQILTVDLNVQVADLDVRTGYNFSQEFALSVDDIDFAVTFEDGTTQTVSADEGGEIVVENASGLIDTNGNGQIDYSLAMTPDATLFNDTEFGMNVGYTLDFLKAQLDLAAALPLDELVPGLGDLGVFEQALSLGPVLQLTGDLDVISADVFESLFAFDAGTAAVDGSFDLVAEAPVAPPAEGGETDDGEIEDGAADEGEIDDGEIAPLVPPVVGGKINGTRDADTIVGSDGRDKIKAKGGDDFVQAGGDRDKVIGGGGDDVIFGEDGRDKLKGGNGFDVLSGGAGNDVLIGGKGDDFLQGDDGADTFEFAKGHGQDNIGDFEVGVDILSFGRGVNGLDDLTFEQQGSSTLISYDTAQISLDAVLVEDLLAANNFDF